MSGLWHVGPIGTPGHDKQTTPDFIAEFVKCSRERYCMLKVISQLAWRAGQWKTALKMVNLFVASPYVEITLGCITAKTSLQGPLWPSSKIFWLKCCLRCLKTIVCDCCLRWTCNIKLWCMQMSVEHRLKHSSCSRLGPLWRQFQACEQI